jgi:hypothetical protein
VRAALVHADRPRTDGRTDMAKVMGSFGDMRTRMELARSSQNGGSKRSLFECGCYHNLWAVGI